MLKYAIIFCGLALACPALAQTAPPSDLELTQLRAQSAEAQAQYLTALLRRMDASAKTTADWWSSYVAGLVKPTK